MSDDIFQEVLKALALKLSMEFDYCSVAESPQEKKAILQSETKEGKKIQIVLDFDKKEREPTQSMNS